MEMKLLNDHWNLFHLQPYQFICTAKYSYRPELSFRKEKKEEKEVYIHYMKVVFDGGDFTGLI